MTDKRELFKRAEAELIRSWSLSPLTCDDFSNCALARSRTFQQLIAFVGCNGNYSDGNGVDAMETLDQEDRVAVIRLVLLQMKLNTTEPTWSSDLLHRVVDAVLAGPGSTIGDLFHAVFDVFADYPAELSPTRANFIKDLVVECFTRRSAAYDAVEWRGFAEKFGEGATTSQLYLALLAIPPDSLPDELASMIAAGLEQTPYRDEAVEACRH